MSSYKSHADAVRHSDFYIERLEAENQQLRTQVERWRDRAVCSGCGSDVDESGICDYEGCDDGQMIPASDLPGALREACDAQTEQWQERAEEIKDMAAENQQLRDALDETKVEVEALHRILRDAHAAVRVEER